MTNDIADFLAAAGDPEYAQEVLTMHNRLEAFSEGLDRAALECAIKAAEDAIQQRDDLLAAFEKFMDSHEECTDFDGFTAQIVSMDDYHEAQEAIANVKEKK